MSLSLTFMEEMRDKASKMLPTPYQESVDECTSDILLALDYDRAVFLTDSANSHQGENVVDVIRAVRKRLENKNKKVQFFTIQLLDTLVKNCGPRVHVEIAESKGLLRDVLTIAVKDAVKDGEHEAKSASLKMIQNFSVWFANHPVEKLKILRTLVDVVRGKCGPSCFDGIEVDRSVQLKRMDERPFAAPRSRATPQQQQRQASSRRHQLPLNAQPYGPPRHVNAIPLICPTENEISGMLDACLLLAEFITNAETSKTPIVGDDLIANIATQVRRDHRELAGMLQSGAEFPNMDILLSVSDAQVSVVQRLNASIRVQQGGVATVGAQEGFDEQGEWEPIPPELLLEQRPTVVITGEALPHTNIDKNNNPSEVQVVVTATTVEPAATHEGATQQQPPPSVMVSTTTTTAPRQHHRNLPPSDVHGRARQARDVDDEAQEMVSRPTMDQTHNALDDLFGPAAPPPETAHAVAPPPKQPKVAPYPKPVQSVDSRSSTSGAPKKEDTVEAVHVGSVNNDNDDFDAFLNDRLAHQK